MTGNIRDLLLSSEAVASLQMEAQIAEAFTQSGWAVQRSAYYTDPETGKVREADVHASTFIDRPRRRKGIGAPIINFDILCECKNLKGTNLVFEASNISASKQDVHQYWIGFDSEIRSTVTAIAENAKIDEPARIQALYDYITERAYPQGGMALRRWVAIPAPPTDLVSRAYRETKGRKMPDEYHVEGKRINPSWSAVLSALSATRAAEIQTRSSVLSYLDASDIGFYGVEKFTESTAFFLDAQLMRYAFFHPFIVLNAKMWQLREKELTALIHGMAVIRWRMWRKALIVLKDWVSKPSGPREHAEPHPPCAMLPLSRSPFQLSAARNSPPPSMAGA